MAFSTEKSTAEPAPRPPTDWSALALRVLPPWMGPGLLVGIWALVSMGTTATIVVQSQRRMAPFQAARALCRLKLGAIFPKPSKSA